MLPIRRRVRSGLAGIDEGVHQQQRAARFERRPRRRAAVSREHAPHQVQRLVVHRAAVDAERGIGVGRLRPERRDHRVRPAGPRLQRHAGLERPGRRQHGAVEVFGRRPPQDAGRQSDGKAAGAERHRLERLARAGAAGRPAVERRFADLHRVVRRRAGCGVERHGVAHVVGVERHPVAEGAALELQRIGHAAQVAERQHRAQRVGEPGAARGFHARPLVQQAIDDAVERGAVEQRFERPPAGHVLDAEQRADVDLRHPGAVERVAAPLRLRHAAPHRREAGVEHQRRDRRAHAPRRRAAHHRHAHLVQRRPAARQPRLALRGEGVERFDEDVEHAGRVGAGGHGAGHAEAQLEDAVGLVVAHRRVVVAPTLQIVGDAAHAAVHGALPVAAGNAAAGSVPR